MASTIAAMVGQIASGHKAGSMGWRQAALLWVPFCALSVRYFGTTSDDAFIPLRYAWNLLHGQGLVFNPGEHVEGFTSPLHVLVSAVVLLVPGSHALLVAKLASLAFAACALLPARALVQSAGFGPRGTELALALTGSSWAFVHNAANGLETSMAALLMTTLVLLVVRGAGRRPVLTASVAIALVLTRPDTIAAVIGLAVVAVAHDRREPLRKRVGWAAATAGALCATTLARWAYFGDLVPNTFRAKRPPIGGAVNTGLDYLLHSTQPAVGTASGPSLLLAVSASLAVIALTSAGTAAWIRTGDRRAAIAVALWLQAVVVVVVGGDWMRGGRLLAPVALLAGTIQVHGARVMATCVAVRRPTGWSAQALRRTFAVVLLAAVALQHRSTEPLPPWDAGWRLDDRSLLAIGDDGNGWSEVAELLDCARPGDLVAFSEMGFGPWMRRDLTFLDTRGLIDRTIATHSPPAHRHNWGVQDPQWQDPGSVTVQEVLRRRPSLVVTYSEDPPPQFGDGAYTTTGVRSTVPGYTIFRRADVDCSTRPR